MYSYRGKRENIHCRWVIAKGRGRGRELGGIGIVRSSSKGFEEVHKYYFGEQNRIQVVECIQILVTLRLEEKQTEKMTKIQNDSLYVVQYVNNQKEVPEYLIAVVNMM